MCETKTIVFRLIIPWLMILDLGDHRVWAEQDANPKNPAFVSACQVEKDFLGRTRPFVIAMVHEVRLRKGLCAAVSMVVVITEKDGKREMSFMGWQHWGGDEFFEASGGLMTTSLAKDYWDTLMRRKLVFVKDWEEYLEGRGNFGVCSLDFVNTNAYIGKQKGN